MIDKTHSLAIGELYAGTTLIPHTKITSSYYQTMSTDYITLKIDLNILSVRSLQGLLPFLITMMGF